MYVFVCVCESVCAYAQDSIRWFLWSRSTKLRSTKKNGTTIGTEAEAAPVLGPGGAAVAVAADVVVIVVVAATTAINSKAKNFIRNSKHIRRTDDVQRAEK